MESFDVFIIGGGSAGLTAAIYAARAGRKTAVAEGNNFGGVINEYKELANFPSIAGRSNKQFVDDLRSQAQNFGAHLIQADVSGCSKTGDGFTVYTQTTMYSAQSVIIASGVKRKSIPMFDKLLGQGVSYCATCDGFFYKDKRVAVYGSGFTALDDALYLSGLCEKVYLLCPKSEFAKSDILDTLKGTENVEIIYTATVTALDADSDLQGVEYIDTTLKQKHKLAVSGLFVALGFSSQTPLFYGIEQTERGEIVTHNLVETSIEGVFAAGDCTDFPLRQVVTACANGAYAAEKASAYLNEKKK